jgi:hypothetical protein
MRRIILEVACQLLLKARVTAALPVVMGMTGFLQVDPLSVDLVQESPVRSLS